MKKYLLLTLLAPTLSFASASYRLTITNGSSMSLSPAVLYVSSSSIPLSRVGANPIPGFTKLCQTGDNSTRYEEVGASSMVAFKTKTNGLIFPGESVVVNVKLTHPLQQTVHFEAMYGKSKDVCAVASISGRDLVEGKMNFHDIAISSGAFADPLVTDENSCEMDKMAIDCLRSLAPAKMGKIHYFSGYLPSVLSFLEKKYSAKEAQELIIPTSGAVSITAD